jgi:hypothetical protein
MLMCGLKARKQQKKRGKIPSFASSVGQSCLQSWAFPTNRASFANSFANSFGAGCWQSWAFPTSRASFANSFGSGCWQTWAFP